MPLNTKKNSYLDLTQAAAWFNDRPSLAAQWNSLSQAGQEEALILATDYLEQRYKGQWKGAILSTKQALDFPRTGVFDNQGRDLGAIPAPLVGAVCLLAYKANVEKLALSPDVAAGGQPVTESIGPISSTYARGASALTRYVQVESLVEPLLNEFKKGKKVKRG